MRDPMLQIARRNGTAVATLLLAACVTTTAVTRVDWTDASPHLQVPRAWHTATRLDDGTILVLGGTDAAGEHMFNSAELVNAENGRSLALPPMRFPRALHSATLLGDGRVLVVGGLGGGFGGSNVEVYQPATQTWRLVDALPSGRVGHSCTRLLDGRVLLVGGHEREGEVLDEVLIFDPGSEQWSPSASLSGPRKQHTATLLPDGRVLIAGGFNANAHMLQSAEIFDPSTGTIEATGSLGRPRGRHAAALMPDGSVVVSGGGLASTGVLRSVERFDVGDESWSILGSLASKRTTHRMLPLPDGDRVLLLGGGWVPTEIFDIQRGLSCAGPTLPTRLLRAFATVLLPDGDILVVGGRVIPDEVRYPSEAFAELQLAATMRLAGDAIECETPPVVTAAQHAVGLLEAGAVHALGEHLQAALDAETDSPSLLAVALELALLSQVEGDTIAALTAYLPSWLERHAAFGLMYRGDFDAALVTAERSCRRGEGAACALAWEPHPTATIPTVRIDLPRR